MTFSDLHGHPLQAYPYAFSYSCAVVDKIISTDTEHGMVAVRQLSQTWSWSIFRDPTQHIIYH